MYAYYVLTNAAFAEGLYAAAQRSARHAYALAERVQDHWFMAYIRSDLGQVARALGDLADARQHYQASYRIREAFGDPEGMAVALNHLGQVSLLQGDAAEAQLLFARSLAIYRTIGDRGGLATALHGLGMAAAATGATRAATQHLHEALRIAATIGYTARTLAILMSVVDVLYSAQAERAVELLVMMVRHPAADRETSERAQLLLVRHARELAPHDGAAGLEDSAPADLDAAVSRVLVDLAASAQPSDVESAGSRVHTAWSPRPRVDGGRD
jgi:tetratricopeptide (TPR) repeat protein